MLLMDVKVCIKEFSQLYIYHGGLGFDIYLHIVRGYIRTSVYMDLLNF